MAKVQGQENGKKPFYKKWWFCGIIVILVIVWVNNSSKNPATDNTDNADNAKVTDVPQESGNTQVASNTPGASNTQGASITEIPDGNAVGGNTLTRDNSLAVLTTLNTGKFTVGTDIPAGRYVITGAGSGNLFINNESSLAYVNEILGGGDIGVDSVTTDIKKGDTIEVSGMNQATFTPAENVLYTDTLMTGNWLVGIDIAPGRYDISGNGGSGNLFIYDKSGISVVNEILGGGDFGVEKVTADLEEGNIISISGMKEVKLTKR